MLIFSHFFSVATWVTESFFHILECSSKSARSVMSSLWMASSSLPGGVVGDTQISIMSVMSLEGLLSALRLSWRRIFRMIFSSLWLLELTGDNWISSCMLFWVSLFWLFEMKFSSMFLDSRYSTWGWQSVKQKCAGRQCLQMTIPVKPRPLPNSKIFLGKEKSIQIKVWFQKLNF